MSDKINHPEHYTQGGVECIDAIDSVICGFENPVEAFYTAQVLRYIWRWPHKNGLEDLQKAQWYLDRLIEKIESGANLGPVSGSEEVCDCKYYDDSLGYGLCMGQKGAPAVDCMGTKERCSNDNGYRPKEKQEVAFSEW